MHWAQRHRSQEGWIMTEAAALEAQSELTHRNGPTNTLKSDWLSMVIGPVPSPISQEVYESGVGSRGIQHDSIHD